MLNVSFIKKSYGYRGGYWAINLGNNYQSFFSKLVPFAPSSELSLSTLQIADKLD